MLVLVGLLSVGVLLILAVAGAGQLRRRGELTHQRASAELAMSASELAIAMHNEAAVTVGLVLPDRSNSSSTVATSRLVVDSELNDLTDFLVSNDVPTGLVDASSELPDRPSIQVLRDGASGGTTDPEQFIAQSRGLNVPLTSFIDLALDESGLAAAPAVALLRSRDAAAMMRTSMASAYATGSLSGDEFENLVEQSGRAEAELQRFSAVALDQQVEELGRIQADPSTVDVLGRIDAAIAGGAGGGRLGGDASDWITKSGAVDERYQRLYEDAGRAVRSQYDVDEKRATRRIYLLSIGAILVLVLAGASLVAISSLPARKDDSPLGEEPLDDKLQVPVLKSQRRRTIRGRLLARVLPLAVIPPMLLGGVALWSLENLAGQTTDELEAGEASLTQDVIGSGLEDSALVASRALDEFLNNRAEDVQSWAASPSVIQAAVAGNEGAAQQGLVGLPIVEVEALLDAERSLNSSPVVETFLQSRIERAGDFVEVTITDRNGFNSVVTNRTSDFVQSDEVWWQTTWDDGLSIGQPAYHRSAELYAVNIAARIDQPDGVPVGVVRAVVSLALLQAVVDQVAATEPDFSMTVVSDDGWILAETASSHDPATIMSAATNILTTHEDTDLKTALTSPEPSGHKLADDLIFGHARSTTTNWTVIVTEQRELALSPLAPLSRLRTRVEDSRQLLILALTTIAGLALISAVIGTLLLSRRIVGPVLKLKQAAEAAATDTLPEMIEQLQNSDPDSPMPTLETFEIDSGDEVQELADSFASMQGTAARLATEQAALRRNVSSAFVNLGRRNQNLIARQLEQLDLLEADERDSVRLSKLFELDHLATRLRRNAENLLILAGSEPARRLDSPVSIGNVIRGALSEVEQYDRVDIHLHDDGDVDGGVVRDLAHLIAELIENGTRFSPPQTRVSVSVRSTVDGYLIEVTDAGMGMTDDELTEANMRVNAPPMIDEAAARYLGLYVVGKIAQRHDFEVLLRRSAGGGITAQVLVGADLISVSSTTRDLETPRVAEHHRDESEWRSDRRLVALDQRQGADIVGSESRPIAPVNVRGAIASTSVAAERNGSDRHTNNGRVVDLRDDQGESDDEFDTQALTDFFGASSSGANGESSSSERAVEVNDGVSGDAPEEAALSRTSDGLPRRRRARSTQSTRPSGRDDLDSAETISARGGEDGSHD